MDAIETLQVRSWAASRTAALASQLPANVDSAAATDKAGGNGKGRGYADRICVIRGGGGYACRPGGGPDGERQGPADSCRRPPGQGLPGELGTTAGEPSISSGAGGLKFKIFFENCTGGKACTTVTFFTGFTDIEATPAKVNEWNSRNRFTRAYIDKENDPVLAMDIDLDHQGIPSANFGEYLDIWSSLAPKYLAFLRGG